MRSAALHRSVLVLAAALLAAVYAFLVWSAPPRQISPDETANGFFAAVFAAEGCLWRAEPLNLLAPGLVHPRSVKVIGDALVPGGFLGLPVVYGLAGKLFGTRAIPWFTAVLAALAVFAFGGFVARLFGRRVGVIAACLLAFNPVWWYEASRALMPNSLFVSLLIFGAYFALVQPIARHRAAGGAVAGPAVVDWSLAGVVFALAVAVRTSEVYWLAIAALALLPFIWKKIEPRSLAALIVCGVLTLTPFLVLNHVLYGDWLASGYTSAVGGDVGVQLPAGRGAALIGPLQPYLFPLGFAPRTAWKNFQVYGLEFFGWWTVLVGLSLAGVIAAAWRSRRPADPGVRRSAAALAVAAGGVAIWLVLFYGSWSIQDNPDPAAVTIGTSYLRYWLPLFVLSVVPVAWAAAWLLGRLKSSWRPAVGLLAAAAFAGVSAWAVFGAPQEGLLAIRSNLRRYDAEIGQVLARTERNALLVVDRADKLIFPDRAVMYPLRSETTYAMLPRLAAVVPVYYYGITLPPADLEYLRTAKLPPLGLTVDPVISFAQETLYVFRPAARP